MTNFRDRSPRRKMDTDQRRIPLTPPRWKGLQRLRRTWKNPSLPRRRWSSPSNKRSLKYTTYNMNFVEAVEAFWLLTKFLNQQVTRQQEQMAKIKEYEAHVEQMKIEGKRVEGEEKRKYLEQESQIAKSKSEYQVQILHKPDSSMVWNNPQRWLL